jgi:hypothetical protein
MRVSLLKTLELYMKRRGYSVEKWWRFGSWLVCLLVQAAISNSCRCGAWRNTMSAAAIHMIDRFAVLVESWHGRERALSSF